MLPSAKCPPVLISAGGRVVAPLSLSPSFPVSINCSIKAKDLNYMFIIKHACAC